MVSLALHTCLDILAAKAKHTLSPSVTECLYLMFSEILFLHLHVCPTTMKHLYDLLIVSSSPLFLDIVHCFCVLAGHRQDITVLRINNIELSPNLK